MKFLAAMLWLAASAGPLLASTPVDLPDTPPASEVHFSPRPAGPAVTQLPPTRLADVIELIVDDGIAEGDVGVGAVTATQFLWFNRMTPPEPMRLEEIHVLFPPATPEMDVGSAVDLVVYEDGDGDPTNGARLVAIFAESIQAADGVTFSVYSTAVDETLFGDIYLGVIPRFLESGVSPPTAPAAIDTTTSQNRSFLATWTGDPPDVPELPSDNLLILIDDISPGNWMIRGVGSPAPVVDVPTMSSVGLLLLTIGLVMAGLSTSRRGRPRGERPIDS